MKKFLKIIFPLCLILGIISISAISASWDYSGSLLESESTGIMLDISKVNYSPTETLPGTSADSAAGENQVQMINILSTDSKNGLNSNKGTLVKLLGSTNIVYSDQNIQGGNLKNLFQNSAVKNLAFVMQYSTDTEIFCFTFKNDDRTNATADVTKIEVYKTVYKKVNNRWETEYAYKGYATVVYVSSISKNSIDVLSWREGNIPT